MLTEAGGKQNASLRAPMKGPSEPTQNQSTSPRQGPHRMPRTKHFSVIKAWSVGYFGTALATQGLFRDSFGHSPESKC